MPVPLQSDACEEGDLLLKSPLVGPTDPCVVAGYEDCLRETIRFLVQEEHLPLEHPLVAGLNFHLASDTAHKELLRVSDQLAKKLSDELRSSVVEEQEDSGTDSGTDSGADSGTESGSEEEEAPLTQTQVYRITLEEDDSEEESCEMDVSSDEDDEGGDDLITAKDILSNPFLRNELIKLVFQGCDLVASSSLSV